jgi:outer membrane protein assembly factor BamB
MACVRFDAGNSRAAEHQTAPHSLDAAWQFSMPRDDGQGTMPVATTVATDEVVLVGLGGVFGGLDAYNGSMVYAVDKQSGDVRWKALGADIAESGMTDI